MLKKLTSTTAKEAKNKIKKLTLYGYYLIYNTLT